MTEFEKMSSGKIFNTTVPELQKKLLRVHNLCYEYNRTFEDEAAKRREILDKLLPNRGENVFLQGPIFFDYGENTIIGDNTFINYNFTVLDSAYVRIGKNVFIGPNVSLMTANHALRYQERNLTVNEDGSINDREFAKAITIGDNCWLASNVTVIGGVKIGNGCVIGAGSVVTRDIPDNCLAVGNPCKVIRKITEQDSLNLRTDLL